jgi:hypothetical protein
MCGALGQVTTFEHLHLSRAAGDTGLEGVMMGLARDLDWPEGLARVYGLGNSIGHVPAISAAVWGHTNASAPMALAFRGGQGLILSLDADPMRLALLWTPVTATHAAARLRGCAIYAALVSEEVWRVCGGARAPGADE